MCAILAILLSSSDPELIRKLALQLSKKQRHRGPDWSGIDVRTHTGPKGEKLTDALAHERLAIVDLLKGAQPLYDSTKDYILTVNGEIYNHRTIRQQIPAEDLTTLSDCEPIVHLYKKHGKSMINHLDGVFAFVIAASGKGDYFAARDAIGVFPLYYGRGSDGSWWFSSEVKSLMTECVEIREFPPGHYWTYKEGFHRWFNPIWWDEAIIPKNTTDLKTLREAFEKAVVKRLMCDVPYGVLLSGGLDSSLVASIVCRHAANRVEEDEKSQAWYPRVHSFTIGLEGSPDLKAAREAANFLGTVHHEFTYSIQEGLDALSDVIYHIESYDVTTIRASTPMFLMARKIKAFGFKMVLSGEGSDEIFGGYLYFHKAPSPKDFHVELCRKVKLLSRYDCLRANLATSAWGIETRVPFLDKDFLQLVMSLDPTVKMITDRPEGRLEKWVLRKAFDTPDNPYLPSSILWRQKEQFSDGVGYQWINSLKEYADSQVTDAEMGCASTTFPFNPPTTKEAYLYRSIFKSHFPHYDADKLIPGGPSIACSTPTAVEWEKAWANQADPSGRAIQGVHVDSY